MQIYLLRHGDAEDSSRIPDNERSLTPEGRRKLGAVLLRARDAGAAPGLVLASPLRRAQETAELAAQILGAHTQVLGTDALLPDAAPAEVWNELRIHREQPQVLLASHEPLLSQTVAYLLGAPEAAIEMKKATLARVDVEQLDAAPKGVLRWLVPPPMAERSAAS